MKSKKELDLYAKIEPLISFYEEYQELYKIYQKEIKDLKPSKILDVGCGNGAFLQNLKGKYKAKGIDISEEMVKISKSKGLDVECIELCKVEDRFEMIVAIADVLNYMDKKDLVKFFKDVKGRLQDNGYFLFDINTLYGFSQVADGVMLNENKEGFLGVEAEFDGQKLLTNFIFFQKEKECYKRYSWNITQYYHQEDDLTLLANQNNLKLLKTIDITLFSEDIPDKKIFVMQKKI